MKQFSYKLIENVPLWKLVEQLDIWGQSGWELVSMVVVDGYDMYKLILKKEIE